MVFGFYEPISVPEVILGDKEVRVENQPGCHTGSIVPAEYIKLYSVCNAKRIEENKGNVEFVISV